MGVVMFYHLTQSTAAQTALPILSRAQAQGWPVMVRGTDPAALARLDEWLWLNPDDGFLPHGLEGGPEDARQPVLIGRGPAVNGARGVILIDGAPVAADEARRMERIWVLFDGADPARLEAARAEWRAVKDMGLTAQYWAEDGGRWTKKAETAPAG